eukprot:m.139751 g.139751  ORF g.139751 m.139751 type:complete len:908 (+) comp9999_c0_seq1:2-2725(+)
MDSPGDDAEQALRDRISALETALHENQYDYDTHLEYIALVREEGILPKIRHARERMAALFPLTPKLWLEWIEDERAATVPANAREQRTVVLGLFRRATEDYLSPEVWIKYAEFAREPPEVADSDDSDDEQDEAALAADAREAATLARTVYEDAITACGKHFALGIRVWGSFLDFEQLQLTQLSKAGATAAQIEEQSERVLKLFMRQLSIPLLGMQNTKGDFEQWCQMLGAEIDPSLEVRYQGALKQCDRYIQLEAALADAEDANAKLAAHLEYIEAEKSTTPDRVQLAFERAITENALNPTLWLAYGTYLTDELPNVAELQVRLYSRAVRNVSWVAIFWVKYMEALERAEHSSAEIEDTFQKAMVAGFNAEGDYYSMWRAYLDFWNRRHLASETDEARDKALTEWRDACTRALEFLQKYYPKSESLSAITRYQARLELTRHNNVEAGQALFRQLVSIRGLGSQAAIWLDWARTEQAADAPDRARGVFKEAINRVTDYPEHVAQTWLDFESEEGSLAELDLARQRTAKHTALAQQRRDAALQKEMEKKQQQLAERGKSKKNMSGAERRKMKRGAAAGGGGATPDGNEESGEHRNKRRRTDGEATSEAGSAATANEDVAPAERNAEAPNLTVFVANLAHEVDQPKLEAFFRMCGELREVRIVHKGNNTFAYVEFASEDGVKNALAKDRVTLCARPLFISRYKKRGEGGESSSSSSQRTESAPPDPHILFVSNLNFVTTEEKLREMFEEFGALKTVRLVTHKGGASKGYGYVEFLDTANAKKAEAAINGREVDGRPLKVAMSDPKGAREARQHAAAARAAEVAASSPQPASTASPRSLVPAHLRSRGRRLAVPVRPAAAAAATTTTATATPGAKRKREASPPASEKRDDDKTLGAPKSNADFRAMLLGGK